MPVRINIDPNQCAAKVEGAWKKGLFALASHILGECNQYVKYQHGTRESSSYSHSKLGEGKLIWATKYAKRQYWEIKTSLTPGRTWKWCETAKRKHKDTWRRIAEKALRENL